MSKWTWYNIYLGRKLIDQVAQMDNSPDAAEKLRQILIKEDGYDSKIRVVIAKNNN